MKTGSNQKFSLKNCEACGEKSSSRVKVADAWHCLTCAYEVNPSLFAENKESYADARREGMLRFVHGIRYWKPLSEKNMKKLRKLAGK